MTREEDFTRLEINLKGCTDNYRYFRSPLRPRTKMLVLVKADAYGHGLLPVAHALDILRANGWEEMRYPSGTIGKWEETYDDGERRNKNDTNFRDFTTSINFKY